MQRNSAGYAIRSNRNVVAAGCGDADERTSGVSRTPGKRVRANSQRGFEARPLLHAFMTNGPLWPVLHFYLSAQLLVASTPLAAVRAVFPPLKATRQPTHCPGPLQTIERVAAGAAKGGLSRLKPNMAPALTGQAPAAIKKGVSQITPARQPPAPEPRPGPVPWLRHCWHGPRSRCSRSCPRLPRAARQARRAR